MPPFAVNPDRVHEFKDSKALEAWYKKHHLKEPEVWIKVHKKGSGLPSVTIGEALDLALAYGWIDAIRKGFDDKSYLQRYTPRGRKSIWSQLNRDHIARLTEAGRMTRWGEAQVEAAKADGRWDNAYAAGSKLVTPADLLAAIENEPKALETYRALNANNRFALAFRVHHMKTEAGRKKKIAGFVAMLAKGETIYPQPMPGAKAASAKRAPK